MTEVNKEYMSKDEVIKSLSGTPISLDVENDGTRVGTIVDGEKFYNKMLLFDPDRFTHCKNDNEVTVFVDKYTQYIGLYLTYLKYPNDIVDNEECELEKSLQGLVVTTAVDLFRSNKYLLAGQQQQQQQQQ